MSNVCVGNGLTVDEDGLLIVDLCASSGLEFDGVTGCLRVAAENPLARTTVRRATSQTIPASSGACVTRSDQIQYNTVIENVAGSGGANGVGGSAITVAKAGLYILHVEQRDDPNLNADTASPFTNSTTIGLQLALNGAVVAQSRVDRMHTQTHILNCGITMLLAANDVVTALWTIHHTAGPTTAYVINADLDSFLQVTELPTMFVGAVA